MILSRDDAGRCLMCTRGSCGMAKLFDKGGPDNVVLAWSMWSGCWALDGCPMRTLAERVGVEPHFVHSGAHASPNDPRRLRKAIAAKRTVWVHADCVRPGTYA